MTLILSVANSLRSLSFVLLPVSVYFAMKKLRSHDSNGMEKGDFPLRFCMPMGIAFGNDDVATYANNMYHHLMAITAI